MLTPKELQEQQRQWSLANFGPHLAHQPLLGLFEELGELHDALRGMQSMSWEPMHVADAIGDFVIFLADYCTQRGWALEDLVDDQINRVFPSTDLLADVDNALRLMARVAHFQLKHEQRIRHTTAEQETAVRRDLRNVLVLLSSVARHFGWTVMIVTDTVWDTVKRRDFTKFPKNGVSA